MAKKKSKKSSQNAILVGLLLLIIGVAATCMMFLDKGIAVISTSKLFGTTSTSYHTGLESIFGKVDDAGNTVLNPNWISIVGFLLPAVAGLFALICGLLKVRSKLPFALTSLLFLGGAVLIFLTAVGFKSANGGTVDYGDALTIKYALAVAPWVAGSLSVVGFLGSVCYVAL